MTRRNLEGLDSFTLTQLELVRGDIVRQLAKAKVTVFFERHLEKPRYVRDHGKGWTNLDLVERNRKEKERCQKVFFMPAENALLVPAWMEEEFRAGLAKLNAKPLPYSLPSGLEPLPWTIPKPQPPFVPRIRYSGRSTCPHILGHVWDSYYSACVRCHCSKQLYYEKGGR